MSLASQAAPLNPLVVRNPALVGVGPCHTQAAAKRKVAGMNDRHGGPGFFIENRHCEVVRRPHAYFAERSGSGEWYGVLREMPPSRIVVL
jgi:hypothetical protein